MITPDMIAFIIASFCQFNSGTITKTAKLACAEYIVNCSVPHGKETTNKLLNECREQWVEIERKRK